MRTFRRILIWGFFLLALSPYLVWGLVKCSDWVHSLQQRELKAREEAFLCAPPWARDVVWYQIFPERFYNGDPGNDPVFRDTDATIPVPGWKVKAWGSDWYALDPWEKESFGDFFRSVMTRRYGGDLQGILDKLDYLHDLGVTALYLNPVFRAPSLHKYDARCLHHIDENFGPDPKGDRELIEAAHETEDPATWVWTSADKLFLKLIREAHRRKMKIILDGVLNHSGRKFFAFKDLLKNKELSKYAGWYEVKRWDAALPDGFEYQGWYGEKSLPEFRKNGDGFDPAVEKYLFDISERWMAPGGKVRDGIDGWRLDVAFLLPHRFLKKWRTKVKGLNPESYLVGEVWEIDPAYLQGDELDALMNYPALEAAQHFFINKREKISVSGFDAWLKKIRDSYTSKANEVMQSLLASHDTARLRTQIMNPDPPVRNLPALSSYTKLQNTRDYKVDRGGNAAAAVQKLMVIFQATYLGAPMVYYGDEAGMTGANDPDCRKPMLWKGITYEDETAFPYPDLSRPREINKVDEDLLEHYKKMIRIRRSSEALRQGDFQTVMTDDSKDIYGFKRQSKKETILVILNNSDQAQKVSLPWGGAAPARFKDLLNANQTLIAREGMLTLQIRAKWAVILKEIR